MNQIPGEAILLNLLFIVALAVTLCGALIAVLSTRIIRGVCGLALCFIGLAGVYYFLHTPFLALMQILIYVGAVCITIIFAVMLAEPDEPAQEGSTAGSKMWAVLGLGVCVALGWAVAMIGVRGPWTSPTALPPNDGSLKALGRALLTTYSLPFEVISLVLLVAILGALAVAHGGRGRT